MGYTSISFMSTLRHGMNIDLELVKACLSQEIENVSFRYFISDGTKGNYMVKSGLLDREISFADKMDHVICVDPSLPVEAKLKGNGFKRILISLPFGTQFKDLAFLEEKKKDWVKPDLSGFTHIFTTSPFESRLLRETYELGSAKLIEDVVSPYVRELNQKEKQEQIKEKFVYHYPGMKGKKVLAILTAGKRKEEEANPFEGLDLKAVLGQLGKDWFLITNNKRLLECYAALSFEYMDSCGYIDSVLPARELLYFSDALLTNSSIYAYYFASKKKPIYFFPYVNSFFERYICKTYPELFIENPVQISEIKDLGNHFTAEQARFCEDFSLEAKKDPYIEIKRILES